jgi:site-specific DNA-methyltransferase (adenine-specific)
VQNWKIVNGVLLEGYEEKKKTTNWPEGFVNKVICGDCLEVMKEIPDNAIDLTVTSPPYGDLRDFKGFTFDFEKIACELFRVTNKGGVVVWVVNDQIKKGSKSGDSFRQALGFLEVGFNLHDVMIYQKNNPFVVCKYRYTQCFEFMFILTKGRPNTFAPLTQKNKCAGQHRKTTRRGKNNITTQRSQVTIRDVRPKDNIWQYQIGFMHVTKDRIAYKHPAIFPEQLADDHIVSWSNPGDIVLDPMCGAGTTCKMAKINGRNFIGIDCAEEYCEIAKKRVDLVEYETEDQKES